MDVLGISDMSQDSAACVVQDGRLVAAVSEERMSRLKHSGGYPSGAIREVLALAGLKPKDIGAIAVGNTSAEAIMRLSTHVFRMKDVRERRTRSFRSTLTTGAFTAYRRTAESLAPFKKADRACSRWLLERRLRKDGFSTPVRYLDHHLSHAASAFFTSGFGKALVLSIDAYGDGRSGALFLGKGSGLEELASFPPSASLGEFYGAVTIILGYQFGNDEGKTMALAAFGKPTLLERWKKGIAVKGLSMEGSLTKRRRFTCRALAHLAKEHKPEDIAASAQAFLEETVGEIVQNAVEQTGCTRLCLAGGVALNVKMNSHLLELPAIRDIHIFPAPADDGTAAGAALLLSVEKGLVRRSQMQSTALGTSYTEEGVRSSLTAHPEASVLSISEYNPDSTAKELASGKLVGWFNGRMELGPRALGQRSLLADPRSTGSPRRIRKTIKARPEFQPFCPSITRSYAKELLHIRQGVRPLFMTLALPTHDDAAAEVPAVVHVDGSTRPQVVRKADHRAYHELIASFESITGIGGVLNTSLNRSGEPIVRSPRDAINLLLATDLDTLIIEGLAVRRR